MSWVFFLTSKQSLLVLDALFGRSLAPEADSECSWLPRGLILPVTHACPSTNCLGNWGLCFWKGVVFQLAQPGALKWSFYDDRNHFQVAEWKWRQPEQPQDWASPWCCWRSLWGLLHPRCARRLRDPLDSRSRCACCLELILQRGDSWRVNPCKDNESPDYLMTT